MLGSVERFPEEGTDGVWGDINKLLNKISQILLCTIWTAKGLFDTAASVPGVRRKKYKRS